MSLMLVMEQKGWGGVFFRQGRNSDSYRCTWQRDRCSNSHRQTKSSFECDREIPQRSAAARSETEPLLGLSCTEPLYIYPDKQANYQRLQLQKTFPHTIKKKKKTHRHNWICCATQLGPAVWRQIGSQTFMIVLLYGQIHMEQIIKIHCGPTFSD